MAKPSSIQDDEIIKTAVGIAGLCAGALCLPIAVYVALHWSGKKKLPKPTVSQIIIGSLWTFSAYLFWLFFLDRHPLYRVDLLRQTRVVLFVWRVLWFWYLSFGLIILCGPWFRFLQKKQDRLRTSDFHLKVKDWRALKGLFYSGSSLPIGVDVQSQEPVVLEQKERCSHVLVIGATGSGKTTLMTLIILHAIKHNYPVVVIDPKGEDSTLNEIIRLGKILNPNFEDRFRLFSMSKPDSSCRYNPLKHGNANQLKDRIMEAMNWSEQFYQSVSGSFLTALTACTEYAGIPLTLDYVSRLLTQKEIQSQLIRNLKKKVDSGDEKALELLNRVNVFFSKAKEDELAGLGAQISILNNPTFGHLLSFETNDDIVEIDLKEVRRNSQIAYFQLDTLGNGDSARRLGRMIVEDLKSLSSDVYKTEPHEKDRVFFPIFIDEFGSFAAAEFIELLKQSRGAQFALHLFCQGLEDLDKVSPEFRRQVMTNTLTKIAGRIDDDDSVNEFCSSAGTIDSVAQSYQIEGTVLKTKTGMGNLRETKQMKIEHDVLKNLRVGQAVMVSKSPTRISGLQVCQAKSLIE
jgi:type IV secretory pathway TraG/TraD family ATPase VirD4